MHSRWFWKSWVREYATIWYAASAIMLFSFAFYWFYYFKAEDATLHWETFLLQKNVETVSHTFFVGNFEMSIPIESYYLFEYFNGSSFEPNQIAPYIFVVVLTLCVILILSVITTLSRFYYLVGMGLFILFVVSLRLNVLRLFGYNEQYFTIGVIAAYSIVSIYFNMFRVNSKFYVRFLAFTGLTIVTGLLIALFATVNFPFMHLWVTGYVAGLVLTILFILLIGHEIIASFVYLTSSGTSTSKSLRHFMLISVFYLANLIITFMHAAKILDWNFLYVNLYLLFSVSAILTIWGYKKREPIYESITEFAPFGAYFIIALCTISFVTIGSLQASANDPALKVVKDFILFSHLGFGVIFMTYIISNFILMMAENMNVYKVLYRPNRMPYATFRIAGLIAVLGFVFYSDWKTYVFNGTSGFYNNIGDLYELLDRNAIAEAYYLQGKTYGFQNHHSNYIVADMEARKNDFEKAHQYYESANGSRPTEYSVVNDGNLYLLEGKYFTARTLLSKRLEQFPNSGPVQNNLGYAYLRIHSIDSALIMLEKARQHAESKTVAETNFTALICEESFKVNADSLAQLFENTPALIANLLALATTQQQEFNAELDPLASRELDVYSATLLNNYIVYNLKSVDTVFLKQAEAIANDSLNIYYRETLKYSIAHAYYHQNNVSKALSILGELAYLSQRQQGKYNYIMGLWTLDQGSPGTAAKNFKNAVETEYKKAGLYNLITQAEMHHPNTAEEARKFSASADPVERDIANQIGSILAVSAVSDLKNDLQRYQYCRYRIKLNDSIQFENMLSQLQNPNYRAKTLLEMAKRQHEAARTSVAIRYFNRITGDNTEITDPGLLHEIRQFEMLILAYRGNFRALKTRMEDAEFAQRESLNKLLYGTLIARQEGDTTTLTRNFWILGRANVFFVEGVLAAAQYFGSTMPDSYVAYTLLAEAVQVNATSVRLQMAYAREAVRLGFDLYAQQALDEADRLLEEL